MDQKNYKHNFRKGWNYLCGKRLCYNVPYALIVLKKKSSNMHPVLIKGFGLLQVLF